MESPKLTDSTTSGDITISKIIENVPAIINAGTSVVEKISEARTSKVSFKDELENEIKEDIPQLPDAVSDLMADKAAGGNVAVVADVVEELSKKNTNWIKVILAILLMIVGGIAGPLIGLLTGKSAANVSPSTTNSSGSPQ